MKKHVIPVLCAVIATTAAFLSGLFLGRKISNPPVQISAVVSQGPVEITRPTEAETLPPVQFPIDINTASLYEFTALPGIGDVLAQRILDYRASNGPFSSIDELMNVYGISEKRYEAISDYIAIGG